ncbi:MAG: hypothetical protein ACRDGD_11525 [Candidatus Limnocylindria bacterium]
MLAPLVLCALLASAPLLPPDPPAAVAVVPDEPGAMVLPDARLIQAVAGDLDADGLRELVRAVGAADGAIAVEAWRLTAAGWAIAGEPIEVIPPSSRGVQLDPVYADAPVRLLLRHVGGAERVTLATQPHFEEIDVGPACCLLLSDLAIVDGALEITTVADPIEAVDAVFVLDLDGDGTDELLTSRSLPPVGDTSFPTEAAVLRWSEGAFGTPTMTTLRIGSGDTPFIIGDSDDRPGEEAGVIGTLGPPGLFRIRLGADDLLEVDRFGIASEAVGVPLESGRGLAAVVRDEVVVHAWPSGGDPVEVASVEAPGAELVGTVEIVGQPHLVIHQPAIPTLDVRSLPNLDPPLGAVSRSPAAARLASVPTRPYVGALPGGGPDGESLVFYGGRLLPVDASPELRFPASGTVLVATLAGAEPVALVGDRDWLAILHGSPGLGSPGPGGGRLAPPVVLADAWVSILPWESVLVPEADDGELTPPTVATHRLDGRGTLGVGPDGFLVEVSAPPGSRVVSIDLDPSNMRLAGTVPGTGLLRVPMLPPSTSVPNPSYRASIVVSTPAGHGYVASWDVRVLTAPPPLDVEAATPFGSAAVTISGRTESYASVTVDGVPVEVSAGGRFSTSVSLPPWPTRVVVEATDFAGNVARGTVSGIGIFDYRRLPWIPIVAALVGGAAIVLYLRVPRSLVRPRRADDDAILEEIEPD